MNIELLSSVSSSNLVTGSAIAIGAIAMVILAIKIIKWILSHIEILYPEEKTLADLLETNQFNSRFPREWSAHFRKTFQNNPTIPKEQHKKLETLPKGYITKLPIRTPCRLKGYPKERFPFAVFEGVVVECFIRRTGRNPIEPTKTMTCNAIYIDKDLQSEINSRLGRWF